MPSITRRIFYLLINICFIINAQHGEEKTCLYSKRKQPLYKSLTVKYLLEQLQPTITNLNLGIAAIVSLQLHKGDEGHLIAYDDQKKALNLYEFPSKKLLARFNGISLQRCKKDGAENFIIDFASQETNTQKASVSLCEVKDTIPAIPFSYAHISKFGSRLVLCSPDKKKITL